MAEQLTIYKQQFLECVIQSRALKFGSFKLRSERISPYFFNAGELHSARSAAATATAFAKTIIHAHQSDRFEFDIVFGPAYKGIPLCSAITIKLGELDHRYLDSVSFAFDRKEHKTHGETGDTVGAPLKGKRVLIVDDTITDGSAKRDAIQKIEANSGVVVGIIVAFDRKEKISTTDGEDSTSALTKLQTELGVPVLSILTIDDVIEGAKSLVPPSVIKSIEEYHAQFRASGGCK